MSNMLEIAKTLVEPGMKLLDMCGSAIGTVYEPRHIRKMADAEAYRIKTVGGAMDETTGLPIAYKNGEIWMSTQNTDDILKRAETREQQQKIREQKNIESVVGNAYSQLQNAPKVPDDPVDEDKMIRLIGIIKEVSSEELQQIWARIVAGEVKKPGSFSMRTLETIRNISQMEAEIFQRILPLVTYTTKDLFITSDDNILEKYGISYNDVLILDECGLITANGSIEMTHQMDSEGDAFAHNGDLVMFFHNVADNTERVRYGIYSLTRAGCELYSILSHTPNRECFIDFAEAIYESNREKVSITIHQLNHFEGLKVNYQTEIIKELCEK